MIDARKEPKAIRVPPTQFPLRRDAALVSRARSPVIFRAEHTLQQWACTCVRAHQQGHGSFIVIRL